MESHPGENVIIVIEHLDVTSEWILLEYKHVIKMAKNKVIFTNVKDEKLKKFLEKEGAKFREESIKEILHEFPKPWIVLDPLAKKTLEPEEAKGTLIIGGILGAHPPRGRTKKELTDKLGIEARNLGSHQLSIDGAVWVTLQIMSGKRLKDLKFVLNPVIEVQELPGVKMEVELPFAYPEVDGKPLLTPGIERYLKKWRF